MPITSVYQPESFAMKSIADLHATDFVRHPLWSEYYEYTERQEILDWGVDAAHLDKLLSQHHSGNTHAVYTVLKPYPLPDRMRIYIRSCFTTANGDCFDGYVVNDDAYCFSIFACGHEYSFGRNRVLDEFSIRALANLRASLNAPNYQLFPLRYETEILDDEDRLIAGVILEGG